MTTLNELFREQVERTPTAPALIFGQRRVTYRELDARANQLARCLRRGGIRTEGLVAVCMRHSVELVVGLLGIVKAGAAYVGLDPTWPAARIQQVLRDSGAPVTLVDRVEGDERLGGSPSLSPAAPSVGAESREDPDIVTMPDSLFGVVYTSGSTGRPKGVLVTTRSVVARLQWMWEAHPFRPADVAFLYRSYAFVGFALDCFGALLKGVVTVVSPAADVRDPAGIVSGSVEHGVTHLAASASLWRALLDEIERRPGGWPTLRLAKTVGEPLGGDLVERWRRGCPDVTLINIYGASECPSATALDVSAGEPAGGGNFAAGLPAPGARVIVVDREMRVLGGEAQGEVCLGGASLARGYLGQPGMTAERFVPDPAAATPGERVFRTGDMGLWRADGLLEVQGRRDLQVQIRGLRVEIEEVEAALRGCARVGAAAVHARHADGGPNLVAHVVPAGAAPSAQELRAALAAKLPIYMVPSDFLLVDALPLTPTGKLDRAALPALRGQPPGPATPPAPPRTPTEQALTSMWQAVLGLDEIGLDDNFFELGGQSLTGIQIVARIHDGLHVEIPLQALFEAATVRALASAVDRALKPRRAAHASPDERKAKRPAASRLPGVTQPT